MADDRPTVLATAPLRGEGLERLMSRANVVLDPWIDHAPLKLHGEEELAQRIDEEGATILVVEADSCKGPVLERPLTVIASTRGEPTNVDLDGATEHGIPVIHAPGRNADAVAELTIGLIFAAARHVVASDRDVRAGEMFKDGLIPYQRFRGWELNGRTLGLVGLGAIGRAVKWRAEGLGMTVIAHDPYADDATHDLDDLAAEADVVSLHAPLLPATEGMFGADQFAAMKAGAVFVNAARAGLHDEEALVAALAEGRLAAAALDHFANEYMDPSHPLCTMDNVVLTPHIGGATWDTEVNQTTMITDDIERILAGERPERLANPEVFQ
ncbi:MAG: NAD(P)-dependent oxidoreductase [Nitriliruptorales bacterium]|nr:NAD(P)-dependent oxidoreductase [Nitriliruptorales bacterium]